MDKLVTVYGVHADELGGGEYFPAKKAAMKCFRELDDQYAYVNEYKIKRRPLRELVCLCLTGQGFAEEITTVAGFGAGDTLC